MNGAGFPTVSWPGCRWGQNGETARQRGEACEMAARQAWQKLANAVRRKLDPQLKQLCPEWGRRWEEQIATLPEVSWVVVPRAELTVAELTRLGCPPDDDLLLARIEAVGRIADAARLVRPVPVLPMREGERHPPKCSILGSFDQMGPAAFRESSQFWQDVAQQKVSLWGVRIRKGERLCAISLVKRFADTLGGKMARFPDTGTLAAAQWLRNAGIDPNHHHPWNGLWLFDGEDDDDPSCPRELHQEIQNAKQTHGAPPAYYAILVADGDNMSDWLTGRKKLHRDEASPGGQNRALPLRDGIGAKNPPR